MHYRKKTPTEAGAKFGAVEPEVYGAACSASASAAQRLHSAKASSAVMSPVIRSIIRARTGQRCRGLDARRRLPLAGQGAVNDLLAFPETEPKFVLGSICHGVVLLVLGTPQSGPT